MRKYFKPKLFHQHNQMEQFVRLVLLFRPKWIFNFHVASVSRRRNIFTNFLLKLKLYYRRRLLSSTQAIRCFYFFRCKQFDILAKCWKGRSSGWAFFQIYDWMNGKKLIAKKRNIILRRVSWPITELQCLRHEEPPPPSLPHQLILY